MKNPGSVEALRRRLAGEVIVPGDSGYNEFARSSTPCTTNDRP
jgi:hypothetical protein